MKYWTPGQPSKPLDAEILYIDANNQICTVKLAGTELRDFKYPILAWRITTLPNTDKHVKTVYWNNINGKFWPAKRPPNPGLPGYFRIELWQRSDGTIRFEYHIHSERLI